MDQPSPAELGRLGPGPDSAARRYGHLGRALLLGGLFLVGLYLTSLYSYLLFHTLAEVFSVLIAVGVFVIAWNARRFLDSGYLLVLGIASLFVGGVDLLHTLAFKGMGVFPAEGANLPTQLWLIARYLQTGALLLAPFTLRRRIAWPALTIVLGLVTAVLLASVLWWRIFPDAYLDTSGLTPFKIASEYVIIAALGLALALLWRQRATFDPHVLRLLITHIGLMMLAEAAFTNYLGVYDFFNLLGHLLKIGAFFCLYEALIVTGLVRPYDLLFRNLAQSEQALRQAHEALEQRVRARTAELAAANAELRSEITSRQRAEAELEASQQQLRNLAAYLQHLREEERTRLARETHDVLGGALTGLKLDLARLRRRFVNGSLAAADVPAEIDDASHSVDSLVQMVRRIATELRPPLLDDLGLAATLEWQLQEFARRSGLTTSLNVPAEPVPLDDEQATALFRVFQEALTNVARHARATQVEVNLSRQPGDHVVMVVRDNGQGITPEAMANSKSLGLLGMRERVRLLAGELQVEGAPGAGTTVTVRVPVHPAR